MILRFLRAADTRIISLQRRYRIQYRLLAVFLILSLLPISGIGFYAYRISSQSLNTRIGESTRQAMKLLGQNLLIEMSTFSSYANTLSITDELQSVLKRIYQAEQAAGNGGEADEQLYDWGAQTLHSAIDTSLVNSRYLSNIQIADSTGKIVYDLLYGENISGTARILKEVDRTSPHDSLQYGGRARSHDTVILGRKLHNLYGRNEPIGYLLFYINQQLFEEKLFPQVSFGPDSALVFISSANSSVISSSRPELSADRAFSRILSEDLNRKLPRSSGVFNTKIPLLGDCLVVAEYLPDFDDYMTVLISGDYIKADIISLSHRLILSGLILFAVTLSLTLLIYHSIIFPIRRMAHFCEKIAVNTIPLDSRLDDTGSDEFRLLSDTIDSMLGDIQGYLKRQEQDEKRKRELELERLQYQINPHFLFNTLDTLKWIADGHDVPVLKNGIGSLSSLLKSTLMNKSEYITLAEEIQTLSSYIEIQKIRYADSFSVRFDLEEGTEACDIPRFTLQPLLENAIMHGTYDTGEEIEILIGAAFDGRDLCLTVRDNGRGFSPETASPPVRRSSHGIGLANIQERLKLHYGGGTDFSIDSTPGEGTICKIRLPAKGWETKEPPK